MQSGGFSPSSKVSKINSPALVLWGRQDGILDGTEFANKVRLYIPSRMIIVFIDDEFVDCFLSLLPMSDIIFIMHSYTP